MVAMRGDPAGVAWGRLPTLEGWQMKAVYDGHVRGLGPSGRWSWVAARSADRARYGHCAEVVFTSHEGDGHQLSLSISKETAMPLLETPRMVLDALIAALIFGALLCRWDTVT